MIIFTTTEVAPQKIVRNFGLINANAKYHEGAMREKTALIRSQEAYQSCIQTLKSMAKEKGGNAIVNFQLTPGPYQTSGSSYQTHILYATGDAVLLEDS